jgi:hypothetical protein
MSGLGLRRAKNVMALNRGLMSDIVESPDLQRSSRGGFGEVILGHTIALEQQKPKRPQAAYFRRTGRREFIHGNDTVTIFPGSVAARPA